jgi:V-type H+-transporting ATPase subunit e
MGASLIPIIVFNLIWGIVALVCPFLVPKNPNRGVAQVVLVLTGSCCWLFWLCCYMAQMNPLIGPVLPQKALFAIKTYWNGWHLEEEGIE